MAGNKAGRDMIEILDGLHETINYGDSLGVRMYHNVEYEDYPEHWHTGIEIIMPLTLDYTIIVGGKRYHLGRGDIIIINSGVLHALEAPPAGERIILQFDSLLLYNLKGMETLLSLLPEIIIFTEKSEPELYPYVYQRMKKIIREYDEKKTFCEIVIYAALLEIFVKLGRDFTDRAMESGETADRARQKEYLETIMRACNHINAHYQENITLEETAAVCGFSKFHFTRIFKQYMDMTFYEYLNAKRVKCAEGLLYSTQMSVTDIALNSGFFFFFTFNRTFKSVNDCSPSEFRNKRVAELANCK